MNTTIIMRRVRRGLLFALLPWAMAGLVSMPVMAKQELIVLNWSEYLDPELVTEFEQKFDVKVTEIYYDSDDERDQMLNETNGGGYDVVLAAGFVLDIYHRQGWLASIGEAKVPNIKHIDPRWRTAFPHAETHAAPYFWGTLGIAYRKDLVTEPPKSWMDLFRPADDLKGHIVMMNGSRDLLGMALKALGYSANSGEPGQLREAERLLINQQPYVRVYGQLDLTEDSTMVSGNTWVAMSYSGDSLMLKEAHPDVEYVLPQEGGNIWVDYLVVMAASDKQELGMEFINFLNEPRQAARLAEFVWYATPNRTAEQHLSDDYREDPIIYPDAEILRNSEYYKPLPAKAQKQRNQIMARVLSARD